MFLLVHKLSYSQNTSTNLSNCYSDAQVTEIFKGLKQNEYLKLRLIKTESVLKEADTIIEKQKENINTKNEIIVGKSEIIDNLNAQLVIEENIKKAQIEQLNNTILFEINQGDKKARQGFWKGAKTGGIIGIVATLVTIVLIK